MKNKNYQCTCGALNCLPAKGKAKQLVKDVMNTKVDGLLVSICLLFASSLVVLLCTISVTQNTVIEKEFMSLAKQYETGRVLGAEQAVYLTKIVSRGDNLDYQLTSKPSFEKGLYYRMTRQQYKYNKDNELLVAINKNPLAVYFKTPGSRDVTRNLTKYIYDQIASVSNGVPILIERSISNDTMEAIRLYEISKLPNGRTSSKLVETFVVSKDNLVESMTNRSVPTLQIVVDGKEYDASKRFVGKYNGMFNVKWSSANYACSYDSKEKLFSGLMSKLNTTTSGFEKVVIPADESYLGNHILIQNCKLAREQVSNNQNVLVVPSQLTVSGKVVDQSGKPLSVIVKEGGRSNETTTNGSTGEYLLKEVLLPIPSFGEITNTINSLVVDRLSFVVKYLDKEINQYITYSYPTLVSQKGFLKNADFTINTASVNSNRTPSIPEDGMPNVSRETGQKFFVGKEYSFAFKANDADAGEKLKYIVDFGNGVKEQFDIVSGTSVKFSNVYNTRGEYEITFKVVDGLGSSSTKSVKIYIDNSVDVIPTANISKFDIVSRKATYVPGEKIKLKYQVDGSLGSTLHSWHHDIVNAKEVPYVNVNLVTGSRKTLVMKGPATLTAENRVFETEIVLPMGADFVSDAYFVVCAQYRPISESIWANENCSSSGIPYKNSASFTIVRDNQINDLNITTTFVSFGEKKTFEVGETIPVKWSVSGVVPAAMRLVMHRVVDGVVSSFVISSNITLNNCTLVSAKNYYCVYNFVIPTGFESSSAKFVVDVVNDTGINVSTATSESIVINKKATVSRLTFNDVMQGVYVSNGASLSYTFKQGENIPLYWRVKCVTDDKTFPLDWEYRMRSNTSSCIVPYVKIFAKFKYADQVDYVEQMLTTTDNFYGQLASSVDGVSTYVYNYPSGNLPQLGDIEIFVCPKSVENKACVDKKEFKQKIDILSSSAGSILRASQGFNPATNVYYKSCMNSGNNSYMVLYGTFKSGNKKVRMGQSGAYLNVSYQDSNQINVALVPQDFFIDGRYPVWVVNEDGSETNKSWFNISKSLNCEPL